MGLRSWKRLVEKGISGIYAVKDRSALNSHVVRHDGVSVFGRVELSGSVIEHESGYRAATAEIVEPIAPIGVIPDIRRRYPGLHVRSD